MGTTSGFRVTPREWQILALLAQGYRSKEVATRLGVSRRTVQTHLERLFERHGIHSRAEAVCLWAAFGSGANYPAPVNGSAWHLSATQQNSA